MADDTRDRILNRLWEEVRSIGAENVGGVPAAQRAIDAGADPQDLVTAMRAAAYESVFQALYLLTGEEDLVKLAESGAVAMLHEDLLTADPSGREGSDLFE